MDYWIFFTLNTFKAVWIILVSLYSPLDFLVGVLKKTYRYLIALFLITLITIFCRQMHGLLLLTAIFTGLSLSMMGLIYWQNKVSFSLLTLGIGGLMNQAAILSNGFKMPVKDLSLGLVDLEYCSMTDTTRLKWLCDIIPVWRDGHIIAIMSVGDLFLELGQLLLIFAVTKELITFRKLKQAARQL